MSENKNNQITAMMQPEFVRPNTSEELENIRNFVSGYDQDKERAEFEAWCKSIGFTVDTNCFGEYRHGYGHELYSGWQASAERYQSRIAEVKARYYSARGGA